MLQQKLVIRFLPPDLTENDFLQQMKQYSGIKYQSMYFVNGNSNALYHYESPIHSRCYIEFKNKGDLTRFSEQLKDKPFSHGDISVIPQITNSLYRNMYDARTKSDPPNSIEEDKVYRIFSKFASEGRLNEFTLKAIKELKKPSKTTKTKRLNGTETNPKKQSKKKPKDTQSQSKLPGEKKTQENDVEKTKKKKSDSKLNMKKEGKPRTQKEKKEPISKKEPTSKKENENKNDKLHSDQLKEKNKELKPKSKPKSNQKPNQKPKPKPKPKPKQTPQNQQDSTTAKTPKKSQPSKMKNSNSHASKAKESLTSSDQKD